MKQLIFAVTQVIGLSFAASAQKIQPKVIVLLNKASWCHICQENGPRFMKEGDADGKEKQRGGNGAKRPFR